MNYISMPFLQIAKCIAFQSDADALHEFHANRSVFCRRGEYVLFAEFLDALRLEEDVHPQCDSACAYDLTLDKFHNLPDKTNVPNLKPPGPDCRLYFRAYLNHVEKLATHLNPVEEETMAANVLQKFVTWHFHLSLLECKRKNNEGASRYDWRMNGGVIRLWFPKNCNGIQRRRWLEENIENPDPSRPDERKRIQALIDRRFYSQRPVSYRDEFAYGSESNSEYMRSVARKLQVDGVAETIAHEKVENIDCLRPAIRALGNDALKQLIHDIFESIDAESFDASQLAHKYGISKSTLSRFAGIQWNRSDEEETVIPDLWLNTARVFAHHHEYREAAMECGLWMQIEQCLQASE